MEINLEVDATGRNMGSSRDPSVPENFVPKNIAKLKVGAKGGHARIAALKVMGIDRAENSESQKEISEFR